MCFQEKKCCKSFYLGKILDLQDKYGHKILTDHNKDLENVLKLPHCMAIKSQEVSGCVMNKIWVISIFLKLGGPYGPPPSLIRVNKGC